MWRKERVFPRAVDGQNPKHECMRGIHASPNEVHRDLASAIPGAQPACKTDSDKLGGDSPREKRVSERWKKQT
jgi:hypothetical protein